MVGGEDSDASQDAVVFLIHKDPASPHVGQCTGTLVAPNLVLTARHCVSDADEAADCAVDGSATRGGDIRADHDPATLLVYTGKNRPPFKTQKDPVPAAVGAQIVHDDATNLCNHDLALVVLKDPIEGATIAPMRLDGAVAKGDTVTAVGWGITSTTTTPQVRQQRPGVAIVAVGPDATGDMPVPPNQFAVRESICLGDSGGPALDASGAVLGVVSGGGNGQMPTASDPSASCVGASAFNLYTELAPFLDVVTRALDLAGVKPAAAPEAPAPSDPSSTPSEPSKTTTTTSGCSSSPMRASDGRARIALAALGLASALVRRRRLRVNRRAG